MYEIWLSPTQANDELLIRSGRPNERTMLMPPAKPAEGLESFNEIATIRVELEDIEPPIWREMEAPTSMTLKALHETIQQLMGWCDYHLWEFSDENYRYIPPVDDMDWGDKPCRKAGSVRLRDICKDDKTVLTYVYDFGDDWRMNVSVTDIRQGDPDTSYPRYLGGERAAPPEDCGGVPGFYELLDAYGDPEHPDHEEVREWLDERDPHFFDELPIKYALLRIANRRNAARKRLRPKAT